MSFWEGPLQITIELRGAAGVDKATIPGHSCFLPLAPASQTPITPVRTCWRRRVACYNRPRTVMAATSDVVPWICSAWAGAAYMNGEDTGNGGSFARSIAALIDRACDRFEAVWKSGQQPRIEEYLSELAGESPPHVRQLLIELVMVDMEWRWRVPRRILSLPDRRLKSRPTFRPRIPSDLGWKTTSLGSRNWDR